MNRRPFGILRSPVACVLHDDVDTDQIIPARYLTTTVRAGLGRHLFSDWDTRGGPARDFTLDSLDAAGAAILVAGRNFGCGSSREHAAWALTDRGVRAVVAPSFGDIFRTNAHKNGLLTVVLDTTAHAALVAVVGAGSRAEIEIDLDAQRVRSAGGEWPFEMDPFVRHCFLGGVDELAYLVAAGDDIAAWEASTPPLVPTFSRDPAGGAS